MNCPICGSKMVEMIFGSFCPNNCDKNVKEEAKAEDLFSELKERHGTDLVNKILQNPNQIGWTKLENDQESLKELTEIFDKCYDNRTYPSKEDFAKEFWFQKYDFLIGNGDDAFVTFSIDYIGWLAEVQACNILFFVQTSDGLFHAFTDGTEYWEC